MRLPLVVLVVLAAPAAAQTVRVDVTPGHATNTFRPALALGAGIDRIGPEMATVIYQPAAVKEVLSAGWGAVSYRLNTELHVEDWHWNPKGTWSEPNGRGYFVGDAALGEPIRASHGYILPRRGFTRNEGTESSGFSRLTDGDPKTFWKSNPYLEPAFTGEVAREPQWIVIDLEKVEAVNALRVDWGQPFARSFKVQWWTGQDAIKQPAQGAWRDFPLGDVSANDRRISTRVLAKQPMAVRFVRILLTGSSGGCRDGQDRRDCVGYAINELYLGTKRGQKFEDLLHHSPDQKQSATFCSSVDPWHTAADKTEGVQTGLDLFYSSGITRGLPAMIPVPVVYSTPENAAAEIAYLKKRGYPISHVELGEEADGQYMTPEHYGALYLQFAAAIRKVDPALVLGGPAFEGVNEDIPAWPDARGNTSWLSRFVKYLEAHERLGDLQFLSFEHYPFAPCRKNWEDLYDEPTRITHIMDVWRKDGLPAGLPLLVTEVNVAWQSSDRFVEAWGGLWLADYVGAFLTAGGTASYFFHYLPWQLSSDCPGQWGTFALHKADRGFQRFERLAQYHASQLVTQTWVVPGQSPHEIFPATSDVSDAAGHKLVTAYAAHLPDNRWSLLLVNKDPQKQHTIDVLFEDAAAHRKLGFQGEAELTTWGADQYVWQPKGAEGTARPADPPRTTRQAGRRFTLPRASITILRGRITPAG
jgi:hypothetical protein